jgi:hypothetical protein
MNGKNVVGNFSSRLIIAGTKIPDYVYDCETKLSSPPQYQEKRM